VQPARKTVRFTAGDPIQSTPLVKIHVTGVPASSVRYVLSGKLPRGLRFRASDGSVRGRPTQAQRANVRIAATYPSAGGLKQSAFVKVKIQVGGTTSPPIQ